jgi:hypothetical protein
MIVKKEEIINAKKVPAFFNDGMFGSSTHLGTFGVKKEKDWEKPWLLEEELKFIDRYMNLAPNGGEAVYRASVSQSQVIHTLENMHICYLNSSYDRKILEKWKNMESRKFPGHSLYEEISQRLGYRFVVRKVKARNHPSSGNVLYLDIDIENTGFGSFQGKGRLELVIEDRKGGRVSFPIKADPRQWKSGAFIRVTAGILWKPKLLDQTQGQYPCYLYLYDQMTKQEIAFANEKKGQKLCLGMILDYI